MSRIPKPSGRKLSDKGKALKARTTETRNLRPRFLIVCEGEQTEPNYFRSFRINADIEIKGIGQNTVSLIEYARQLQTHAAMQSQAYTDVWVVFDKDDFSSNDFNQAVELARQAGFGTAYSNQAFELWYVLHFDYLNTGISRRQYQDILTNYLGKPYRKNDFSLYRQLLSYQPTGLRNSEKLFNAYQPEHNPARDNPCTTVHLLVNELNRHLR